jgi:antitoxin MazE
VNTVKAANAKHWACIYAGFKWGNSLAIRLPAEVVGALDLKEGDRIEVGVAGDRKFTIRRDPAVAKALARIRKLRRPLPSGFTFDREQPYARAAKSKTSKSGK